jgi:hypothetical protein
MHPLFVHGAVVLIPLAAMAAVVFALKPSWRWVLRWPTAVVTLVALAFLFVARETGDSLLESLTANLDLARKHEQMANLLTASYLPFTVATVVATWTLAGESPLPDGKAARAARWGLLGPLSRWGTVVLAIVVLVFVVLTGDTGARAVWSAR